MKIANIVSLVLIQYYVIATSINYHAGSDIAGSDIAGTCLRTTSSKNYSESKCLLDYGAEMRMEKRDPNSHNILQTRDKSIYSFTSAELKGILEEYSKRLYHYMWPNKFRVFEFENSAPNLERELSEIDRHVKSSNGKWKAIIEHHEFVQAMFDTMADNIENLKSFKLSDAKEYRWLWRTIEIRILLSAVHHTYGDPKLSAENRLVRIECYRESLRFFKQKMDSTSGISYGVRRLFYSYHSEAERLIQAYIYKEILPERRESLFSSIKKVFTRTE